MLFNPTSINIIIDRIVVITTEAEVINCAPLTPIFLPKKPDAIELNKGKTIKVKYIILNLLLHYLLIYKMLLILLIL